MKKIIYIMLTLSIVLIVVGCSTNLPTQDGETVTITQTVSVEIGKDSEGEPIYEKQTVTSTVRKNPKVVVTFALEIADILSVVGLEKAGITYFGLPKANLPESIRQFASNKYPNTGTLFEPNYDTLDLMMPDLIIIGGRSSSLYSSFKSEYPNTDILDVSNTTFTFERQKEVFTNLGLIFPEIKVDLEAQQAKITQNFETVRNKVDGHNALFLQVNGDQISVFGVGSRYGVLYSDFNFVASDPDLKTLEAHGNIVSFEYVSEINPQIIFLMDRSAAVGSSGAIDQIINNALIQNTDAGKNNDIYILDPMSWYILPGGINSSLQMIEDIDQVFK